HGTRCQLARAAAHDAVPRHVLHLSVETLLEPAQQVPLVLGDLDARPADRGKAERGRARGQLAPHLVKLDRRGFRHGGITPASIISRWRCPLPSIPRLKCARSMRTPSTS